MTRDNNRRSFGRIPLGTKIKVAFPGVEARRQLFLENLGSGGLFIRTDQLKPIGTKLDFEFSVRDGGATISGSGIVRWVEDGADKMKGMGIKFTALNDEGRTEIAQILKELKK